MLRTWGEKEQNKKEHNTPHPRPLRCWKIWSCLLVEEEKQQHKTSETARAENIVPLLRTVSQQSVHKR